MTDRELLELAAKGAGITVGFRNSGMCVRKTAHSVGPAWNPLAHNGDALHLAATLGLCIRFIGGRTAVVGPFIHGPSATEDHGENAISATRRAIVRAAAEIGKAMKGEPHESL